MNEHILIVEDDETILSSLKEALLDQSFYVVAVKTLVEARAMCAPSTDLILLDLGLPDGDGFEFLASLKKIGGPSVVILTARDDEQDIIKGLDLGADDYVTKPFKFKILLSRIRAVIRRLSKVNEPEDLLICQNICLNKLNTSVTISGIKADLTAGEYRLLEYLMENKNRTLTRSMLLEHLWDIEGEFVDDNTLTVAIKRLRQKLGSDPQRIIKTVRGIGYRVEDKDE